MTTRNWLGALGILAGGTALFAGADYAFRSFYNGPDHADGRESVTTDDGLELTLHRYGHEGTPVLLVPGLGINYRHYDIADDAALAPALRDEGYTAYTLDLRGVGHSPDRPTVRFDDYVQHDIPAAVRRIERRHGRMPHYVGHSMGGMLYFASAAYHDFEYQSAVALGAPVHGGGHSDPRSTNDYSKTTIETILPYLFRFAAAVPTPGPPLARLGAGLQKGLLSAAPSGARTFFVNMDNMHASMLKKAAVRAVDGPKQSLVEQFARWVDTGRWTTMDGSFSYRENISTIETPTRMIGASLDEVAPLHNQRTGRDLLSGDHELIVVGTDAGCERDYSHVDLICGRNVETEVYPQVVEWLDEHD